MQRISVRDDIKLKNTIVTVGKFDGIHKGHEKLFETLAEKSNGRQKVVLTFETTPKAFLENSANKTIVTEEEKQMLCQQQGIDVYMKMPMEKEFLALTPEQFVCDILKEKIGATTIVCGPDFRFGTKASGDVDFLRDNQEKYGYKLVVVEKEQYNDFDISSTAIRERIVKGQMSEVNEMLGHPYRIIGRVEEGKQLGRTIGIPTANVIPDANKLLPPNGVYKTVVVAGENRYKALTNIGVNPTVEDGSVTKIESHLLDFSEDLYGEIIQVLFYEYVREECQFDSVTDLKEQIEKDIEKCK